MAVDVIVPVYTSPGKFNRLPGFPFGQLEERVLFLVVFDGDPLPTDDPTSGSIFYVEQTDEGWTVSDDWYRFDANSQEEIDTRKRCQIYLGTLPVAEEEDAAAEA